MKIRSERVVAAIRELDYRPNTLARSLVTNRSLVIGLVIPNISQPFYPEIARGVEDEAYEASYSVFLCDTAGDSTRELQALERLRGHRVDGVIICNSRLNEEALALAATSVSPVVLVNRSVPNVQGTVIWTGYDSGASLAVEHLLSIGRREVAYIGLNYDNHVDKAKYLGYKQALERAGFPHDPRRIIRVPNSFQGGYEAMASLVVQYAEMDAIFAFNDLMAIGAMRYALTHQIDVPGQVAIVGFGGSDLASMVTPDLSTISVPLYSIGRTAMQELLHLIAGTSEEHRQVNIQPELLLRASSVSSDSVVASCD